MGEWSKKIGEKGEKIVQYLFTDLLGHNIISNESIDCNKKTKHKNDNSASGRKTHGIDSLFTYKSPLEDKLLEICVVSSKFSSKIYPNSPKTEFKSHLKDLAQTIECFKYSKLYSELNQRYSNINRTDITGILIWLSNASSDDYSVINKISNSAIDSSLVFDKIIVIDNDRINFLYETIQKAKEQFGAKNIKFVYHNSNLNNIGLPKLSYDISLPIDYLFSDLIPIRVEKGNNEVQFIVFSKDEFSENNFLKILNFVKSFDHLDTTHSIIISFSEYNELECETLVSKCLTQFTNYKIGSNLFLKSHNSSFKNS